MTLIANITRASAKHRNLVLSISAVFLLLLGAGINQLQFSDNPTDAMPRGDPNTDASYELLERFPGVAYASAIYISAAPDKWEEANKQLPYRLPFDSEGAQSGQASALGVLNPILEEATQGNAPPLAKGYPGPNNITDEVYMRATEELFEFLLDRVPEMEWGITLPSQIKLVNYTNTGIPNPVPGTDALSPPDADAFSMPGTGPNGERLFNVAWQSYWAASLDSIKTITSKDWTTARMGLLYQPGEKRLDEIGDQLYVAVEEYKDAIRDCDAGRECTLQWNAFNPDEVIVDPRAPAAAASYLTKTTLEDLYLLAPFAAGFIFICLFAAFRRPGTVVALLIPMGLAGIGVLGVFGFIGLPIHSVSLLVFPVLMGNGIDFGIHMAAAYHDARSKGEDVLQAAYAAGSHAGIPLFIATLTTLVGMSLLLFAPNRLLSQLGLAIMLGMVILLVVSLTALPAALSFTKTAKPGRNYLGRAMAGNARFWHKNRWIGVGVLVSLVGGALVIAEDVETLIIGTPAAFFPEGDRQREDFDHSNERYFKGNEDLVTNALVLKGDIASPQSMEFMERLEGELKKLDFVRNESAVSLHFAVKSWIQVREGTAGAAPVIAQETLQPGSTFPDNREDIKFLIDEMFETPLATYASFFVNQPDAGGGEYDISVVLVEIYQDGDFESLEAQWDAVWATVDGLQNQMRAEGNPSGLDVFFTGQTAVAYLFTAKEMPYVQLASMIGLGFTGFLVLAIRRSPIDALTVALVVGSAGLMWLGSLSLLDIPLSIALVVPVVIIAAIGSDYALHLRYGLWRDNEGAWMTVGRAVIFSAITDLGAFLVFTQMRYGLLADATLATASALLCSLVATMIVVPILARNAEFEGSQGPNAPKVVTATVRRKST